MREFVLLVPILLAAASPAADFFASPAGSPQADGSLNRPWDMATALKGPPALRPGDTLWLRGGTYRGTFSAQLRGKAGTPIIVRPRAGEKVIVDLGDSPDGFEIGGNDAWYEDFEIMSSSPRRVAKESGSSPHDLARPGVRTDQSSATGRGLKLINLVIHDTAGIGLWKEAADLEVSGCLIFNNGWSGPDRGHGHGLYVQNVLGEKRIEGNVIFNQFDNGIQVYGSRQAGLDNIAIEQNVVFNNGSLTNRPEYNIVFGGGRPSRNARIVDNVLYYPEGSPGTNLNLGFADSGAGMTGGIVEGNYLGNGGFLWSDRNSDVVFRDNEIHSALFALDPRRFPGNTISIARGKGTRVFIHRNSRDPGRATVSVFNWDRKPFVEVDLTKALPRGARCEIRNAQNPTARPIWRGTIRDGTLTLPMTGLAAAVPVGWAAPPPTGPEFNVFLVNSVPAPENFPEGHAPGRTHGGPAPRPRQLRFRSE
jgi:hypothetical protein